MAKCVCGDDLCVQTLHSHLLEHTPTGTFLATLLKLSLSEPWQAQPRQMLVLNGLPQKHTFPQKQTFLNKCMLLHLTVSDECCGHRQGPKVAEFFFDSNSFKGRCAHNFQHAQCYRRRSTTLLCSYFLSEARRMSTSNGLKRRTRFTSWNKYSAVQNVNRFGRFLM